MMQFFRNMLHPPMIESRHYPSGLNRSVQMGSAAFVDYVAQTRDVLRRAHSSPGLRNLEKVVEGNAPFELRPAISQGTSGKKPYRRGVLLTHGLSDSPYFMRHLGAFYQEQGFRVMAILLPGHGTQPGDLLDVGWQEWAAAVAYGVDRLAEEAEEVYLAGFSAGGALSVYQSLWDDRVRGLFLFSPALRISSRAAFARFRKLYSWLIPAARWLELKPDWDIYKYESFPINAVEQMHALTGHVRKAMHRYNVEMPVFAAASAEDATVDPSATIEFIALSEHRASKFVLYASDPEHILSRFPEVARINGETEGSSRLEIVSSIFPEQRILSFAHTSLVLPPEDEHYGISGDYSNCLHYFPREIEKFSACNNNPLQVFQGELTEKNLDAGILRRLMYNPDFSGLKASMRSFIDELA